MAAMEQLEVHSKSYIVRWVKADEGHTISWSIQPHKKSLNFGIFKHPGTGSSTVQALPSSDDFLSSTPRSDAAPENSRSRATSSTRNDQSTAQVQLKAKGFILREWYGKCEADKVSMGTYQVPPGQGGMYGLVLDNTFSKQISKTATLVLLTYPSDKPPNAAHYLHNLHNTSGSPTEGGSSAISIPSRNQSMSPQIEPTPGESVDSLHSSMAAGIGAAKPSSHPRQDSDGNQSNGAKSYHVGVLQKRRRKRGQGYARRFFSLDFVSCTLSYYYNRNSSALRGAIPLSLAAISADERKREISIDSGAEIWHLKAMNAKDFQEWANALQKASNTALKATTEHSSSGNGKLKANTSELQVASRAEDDQEWGQVESLVSRIVGTRDALRRLAKDTAPSKASANATPIAAVGSPAMPAEGDSYFPPAPEKRPFWKRKQSSSNQLYQKAQAQLAVPTPATVSSINATGTMRPASRSSSLQTAQSAHHPHHHHEEHGIHEHCTALLNDLESALSEFSALIAKSKSRRMPPPTTSVSRASMESDTSVEFFDAEGGESMEHTQSHLLKVRASEEGAALSDVEEDDSMDDSSSISSADNDSPPAGSSSLFPPKPKSFSPLPIPKPPVRRETVPAATVLPPSLIGFLRKNVGKDLSTISMPVSANEPISLLQRAAEQLEYAQLLDTAAQQPDTTKRLLYVTAFAISSFSSGRVRERAIRKPFNPMLGETYELVRSSAEVPGGFRFIAEKIKHRPDVRMACQADSANWSLTQSPSPIQKFWGKSAEIVTDGRVRIVLRRPDGGEECFSYAVATVFLRNVVMGEKYVEPVGSMTVLNESTGAKAVIEFKNKGMFGGRSEELSVDTFDASGSSLGLGLRGTWTESIQIFEKNSPKTAGKEIWRVGELVKDYVNCYGFTKFVTGLNEVTEIEEGKLPPTDCRLRPDQRAAERGDLEKAEVLKAKLENAQRERRKVLEGRGEEWRPRWFERVEGGDGAEEWRLKGGKEGYWEERQRGDWKGVERILEVE